MLSKTLKEAVPFATVDLTHSIVPLVKQIISLAGIAVPLVIVIRLVPAAQSEEAAAELQTADPHKTDAMGCHVSFPDDCAETSILYSVPFTPKPAVAAREWNMRAVALLTPTTDTVLESTFVEAAIV